MMISPFDKMVIVSKNSWTTLRYTERKKKRNTKFDIKFQNNNWIYTIGLIRKTPTLKPVPLALEILQFCCLHETKKCWEFKLDIFNSSWVVAIQKYIEHNWNAENVPTGVQMSNFLILTLLGYCTK